jgi:hypothetical protein
MNTFFSTEQTDSTPSSDRSLEAEIPFDAAPFGRGASDPTPRRSWLPWAFGGTLLLTTAVAGAFLWSCLGAAEDPPARKPPAPTPPVPEAKRKEVGKNVFLEVQGDKRRVVVKATVCLREGVLEGLLCRKQTKEHEYVLSADVDASLVHATLIAARAKPGNPVKFQPRYVPASGTVIKITLQYQKDGKLVSVPAQQWLRDGKANKVLEQDWVFGGSQFITDPDEPQKPPIYLANHGDMVCVCNMESAMLDLPVRSPKRIDDRVFSAFTERIPALETVVDVILEPVPVENKEKDAGK